MTDLTDWLAEVHAADKRAARLAGGQAWPDPCSHGDGPFPPSHDLCARLDGPDITIYDESGHTPEQARHIARHDPQSVLARIEAERMLASLHQWTGLVGDVRCPPCEWGGDESWPCPTLRALAWGYRGRDGYRAEWAPDGVEVEA